MPDAQRRTPQQQRAHATQSAILDGAAKVFERTGYANATLSMIAEQSGISAGSMYFHFKTKEQIALAIIHEQHARSLPLIQNVLKEDMWVVDKLIRISRGMVDQLQHDSVVRAGIRLVLEDYVLSEPAAGFYNDWINATARLLKPALDAGELVSELGALELARSLIAFFTGVQMTSQAMTGRKDLKPAVEHMWSVLIAAIVPSDARAAATAALGSAFAPQRAKRSDRPTTLTRA